MYIIIKRDKAEHLKEKMHAIKAAALEVLGCLEEAGAMPVSQEHLYGQDAARRGGRMRAENEGYPMHHPGGYEAPYSNDGYPVYPEEAYHHDMARRGRGRY